MTRPWRRSNKGKTPKLTTTYISQSDLKEKVRTHCCFFDDSMNNANVRIFAQAVTKVQAKSQTREDIARRKQQLTSAQKDDDSDKDDDGDDVR